MLSFNNENEQKLDSDWNRPGLLKFPKLKSQLKRESKIHRDIYKEIVEKFRSRHVDETLHKIKRYDVEINLQRMLYKNDKYIGLTRNRHKESSIFGNKSLNKLNLGQITGEESLYNSCHRFEQYSKRFEERCLNEIFEANIYNHGIKNKKSSNENKKNEETDDEDKRNYYNSSSITKINKSQSVKIPIKAQSPIKQFISSSVIDFNKNAGRTSTIIESNPSNMNGISSLRNNESRFNMESILKSNSKGLLKPKKHVVIAANMRDKIVLPSIKKNNKNDENNAKDDYKDDFDDELKDINDDDHDDK